MYRLVTFFTISFLIFSSKAFTETCVKTYRTTDEPPFNYKSDASPYGFTGIYADSVRLVLNMMGCEIVFVEIPWARALAELSAGRVDIVSGAFDIPERRRFAHYAEHGYPSANMLFMRAQEANEKGIKSFSDFIESDLTLGALIDVNYGPEYWQAKELGLMDERLNLASSREVLWRMLDRGRVDAVIANHLAGIMDLSELGYSREIHSTGIELSSAPAFIIFSKASVDEAFVKRFNEAYKKISENGMLQQISDTHTRIVRAEK